MYTYANLTSDLPLVATGVAIWAIAIGIAVGVYLPAWRSESKWLRGFTPARRARGRPANPPGVAGVGEDFDDAALPLDPSVSAQAPAILPPPAQPDAAAASARPEAFSVLVVDDNPINRQVLELILDSVGVAHASVENGLEAVEAMQACAYDAVLMDLQMPVMDGFEATRRIRALEAARGAESARIIVVSANCAAEDVAQGRSAGADCHLAKPISAAAIIGELAACPALERFAA